MDMSTAGSDNSKTTDQARAQARAQGPVGGTNPEQVNDAANLLAAFFG